jgi:hypothetical protein
LTKKIEGYPGTGRYDYSTIGPEATTNAYVTMTGGVWSYFGHNKMTMQFIESAGEDTMYSIDGSMDNVNWINLMTDVDLPANTTNRQTFTDLWNHIRVQIIDKVGGTHGAVTVKYEAQRM